MFRYGFEYHYECSKMFNVYMYNSLITVILNLCRFNIVYTQYFKLLPYNIQLIFEKKTILCIKNNISYVFYRYVWYYV